MLQGTKPALETIVEQLMTTREVAEYLRLKERKIYDLVAARSIPCTRITGKWLFPRVLIDRWIMDNTDCSPMLKGRRQALPVVVGDWDALLNWAVRESSPELALLFEGSSDGLGRLTDGRAVACGLCRSDVEGTNGQGNGQEGQVIEWQLAGVPCVVLHWAQRRWGLALGADNPVGIDSLADLPRRPLRLVARQGRGDERRLQGLLARGEGPSLGAAQLTWIQPSAREDSDVAAAILARRADAGLVTESVAQRFQLRFLPLGVERYDLIVERREFFEAPLQQLMTFVHSEAFVKGAADFGGYDISRAGAVLFNAP